MPQDIRRERELGDPETDPVAAWREEALQYRANWDGARAANVEAIETIADLSRQRDSARAWAIELEQQLAEKSRQLADLQRVAGIPLHIGSIPMEEVGRGHMADRIGGLNTDQPEGDGVTVGRQKRMDDAVAWAKGQVGKPYNTREEIAKGTGLFPGMAFGGTPLRDPTPKPRQWVKGDPEPDDVSVVVTADGRTWTKTTLESRFAFERERRTRTTRWISARGAWGYWGDLLAYGTVTEGETAT